MKFQLITIIYSFFSEFNLINVHEKLMGIKPTVILSLFHLLRDLEIKMNN